LDESPAEWQLTDFESYAVAETRYPNEILQGFAVVQKRF
jgi:hypothetical protein